MAISKQEERLLKVLEKELHKDRKMLIGVPEELLNNEKFHALIVEISCLETVISKINNGILSNEDQKATREMCKALKKFFRASTGFSLGFICGLAEEFCSKETLAKIKAEIVDQNNKILATTTAEEVKEEPSKPKEKVEKVPVDVLDAKTTAAM